jgi:hypothetical protein
MSDSDCENNSGCGKFYHMRFTKAIKSITGENEFAKGILKIVPILYFVIKKETKDLKIPAFVYKEYLEDNLQNLGIDKIYIYDFDNEKLKRKKIEDIDDIPDSCICTHYIEKFFLFKTDNKYFLVGSSCQKRYPEFKEAFGKKMKELKKNFNQKCDKILQKKILADERKKKEDDEAMKIFDDMETYLSTYKKNNILKIAANTFVKNGKYEGKSWLWLYENKFNETICNFHSKGNASQMVEDLYFIFYFKYSLY